MQIRRETWKALEFFVVCIKLIWCRVSFGKRPGGIHPWCIYIRLCTRICTWMCKCTCSCICICICVYVYVYILLCTTHTSRQNNVSHLALGGGIRTNTDVHQREHVNLIHKHKNSIPCTIVANIVLPATLSWRAVVEYVSRLPHVWKEKNKSRSSRIKLSTICLSRHAGDVLEPITPPAFLHTCLSIRHTACATVCIGESYAWLLVCTRSKQMLWTWIVCDTRYTYDKLISVRHNSKKQIDNTKILNMRNTSYWVNVTPGSHAVCRLVCRAITIRECLRLGICQSFVPCLADSEPISCTQHVRCALHQRCNRLRVLWGVHRGSCRKYTC